MITLVDYGAGNLRSVANTMDALGVAFHVSNSPADVNAASKLILPGVGHFGQMMRSLDELGLRGPLLDSMARGIPLLGVCVGLQCLFTGSEEAPEWPGLGVLPGMVRRFTDVPRVPHMGWNTLSRRRESRLLEGLGLAPFTYFANSYSAPVVEATAAAATYGFEFSAVIEHRNLYAVQFHPEKSGPVGLRVVRNFAEL